MLLNACFGDECYPIQADENWSWEQTIGEIKEIISNKNDNRSIDYEVVRPGHLAEKWTSEMNINLGQASTLSEMEQAYEWKGARNGPFQLYLYPKGALIVIVEDTQSSTTESITFYDSDSAATTIPGLKEQIGKTLDERRGVVDGLQLSKGWFAKVKLLFSKLRHDNYELDASNEALFEKWRSGSYDDPQFMPIIQVNSSVGLPLLHRLKEKKIKVALVGLVGIVIVAFAVQYYFPEVSEYLSDTTNEVGHYISDKLNELIDSLSDMLD